MKLDRVDIYGYASIKEKLTLHVDARITTLIGANDTGKTNLLKAIRCLNEDAKFALTDRNWDLPGETTPTIEWSFTLSPRDRMQLASALETVLKQQGRDVTVKDVPEEEAIEIAEAAKSDPENSADPANSMKNTTIQRVLLRNKVGMRRSMDSPLGVEVEILGDFPDFRPPVAAAILNLRPRVELFTPAEQLMDVITLAQLDQPEQEFMQGIFRYAGIWEERKLLFSQTPATEYHLVRASETFTDKIRREWQQGENLTFRLSHTGQNGDHIQLYIGDPAVGERFVRPSERSEGFSAFFKMDMRLRARTAASPASTYIFLFDEPGVLLHPAGQVNLLRVFERLSDENQITYATHSIVYD